jgi:hypothetical protein
MAMVLVDLSMEEWGEDACPGMRDEEQGPIWFHGSLSHRKS